jgi:hypothetical protein
MTINYVLQFLVIVFIICMCLYVIYKILFSIINLIDEKRKREKELKDFINYIKDEDLKREWEVFFKKDYAQETNFIDWENYMYFTKKK